MDLMIDLFSIFLAVEVETFLESDAYLDTQNDSERTVPAKHNVATLWTKNIFITQT